jgi:hypothetical protein
MRAKPEVELWPELVPFLAMPESIAVAMLAEYVVFQETPSKARVSDLCSAINSAIESCSDEDRVLMAAIGLLNGVPWSALLSPRVEVRLRTIATTLLANEPFAANDD